ncbi:hypothetical protein Vafri_4210, partial [Volvox africanus]
METDEACSETTGDGRSSRIRERNGNIVPDETIGIRPSNPAQCATNRGESVSVPSATPVSVSIDGRYKDGPSLCVDLEHKYAHVGLPGLTTEAKRDAKHEAAVHVKAAARSSAETPGTRIITCDEDTSNTLTEAAGLRLPSPLHCSRSSAQPWSRLAKLPTSVSAAAQVTPGTRSITNKLITINSEPGVGGTARNAACEGVSGDGTFKNEPSALDGLLFAAAAAAAAAGILRESSGPPSGLKAVDSKDLRALHAATSPTSQSGELSARKAALVHARPPKGSSAAIPAATGDGAGCGSGKPPGSRNAAVAATSAAFAINDSAKLAPWRGPRSGEQFTGGTQRCSGGGGGGCDPSSRGQHLHQQHYQLLPAPQRQASKGDDEEGWRSRHHSKQTQPSATPHVVGAGTVSCGEGGTTRGGTTSQYAGPTCGAGCGSGAAAAISAPCLQGAVRSKGVLSPKVPVIMPRQFAERIMDPSTILKHGITVVVRRIGPVPPGVSQPLPKSVSAAGVTAAAAGSSADADARRGRNGGGGSDADGSNAAGATGEASGSADLVLTAQVEQFFHAQGYSQYRVLGLKEISCGYHNWRIEMWEALDDRTVRLTICAPSQAVQSPAPPQLMFPQSGATYRGPQEGAAATSEGDGGGGDKGGDAARGLHPGTGAKEPADKEPHVKRDPGLECTEEVGEEDYDDAGGGGSASAAAAPLELEAGRGAHLLVAAAAVAAAAAAAAGRPGRCSGGGGGFHVDAAGAGAGRRPRGEGVSGGAHAGDGRGGMSVLGMKRGAEVGADVEAGWGSGTEDPDTSDTTRLGGDGGGGGSGGHKLLRTSAGAAARAVRDPGCGGGGKDDLGFSQVPGPEAGRPGLVEPGHGGVWDGKARPVRRTAGGWRDTAAAGFGGSGAFGGYSSLPAEDMPQALPGALASSPHPCRKGGATVLSPDHFIHLPRLFFQDNFDTAAVLSGGLRVQVQAGNLLDPTITTVSVASYQNHTGYRYYRLLGFKDVPRRYVGWRVAAWDKVAADMVRVRLSPPLGMPLRVALVRAGQLASSGSIGSALPLLPEDAAAAIAIGGGDTAVGAAVGLRDSPATGNGSGNVGSGGGISFVEGLLPPQRRLRSGEAAAAAGSHRLSRPAAGALECRSEDEEDRAAGLAMMNLGWELREKRLPQQEQTSPGRGRGAGAGTMATVPHPPRAEGKAADALNSREATAAQSSLIAKMVAGMLGTSAGMGKGKGQGDADGGGDSDMGSGDDGNVGRGIKRGVHRPERAAANATAAAGDGGEAGCDSDAGGSPAGVPPPARRRPAGVTTDTGANNILPHHLAASSREASLPHLLPRRTGQGMACSGSSGVFRHAAPSTAEVRRIMEAGVAAAVARLEVPVSRVRSVVSQNQSVVRPDKGRVYLQKPFVESSLAVTATPLSVQVVINSGGQLDPATYPTKVTLSSSGAHGKAEYLLRLTAPMKHAHSGQLIVGWSAMGRQQLLMHLVPAPQAGQPADLRQEGARTVAGQIPAPPSHLRARVGGMMAVMAGCGTGDNQG